MSTVKTVAKRIEHEVGLSPTASVRIVKKLNKLAKSVTWARPLEGEVRKAARRVTVGRKLGARPLAAAKARRRLKKKK